MQHMQTQRLEAFPPPTHFSRMKLDTVSGIVPFNFMLDRSRLLHTHETRVEPVGLHKGAKRLGGQFYFSRASRDTHATDADTVSHRPRIATHNGRYNRTGQERLRERAHAGEVCGIAGRMTREITKPTEVNPRQHRSSTHWYAPSRRAAHPAT